jgi:hypothetical protein
LVFEKDDVVKVVFLQTMVLEVVHYLSSIHFYIRLLPEVLDSCVVCFILNRRFVESGIVKYKSFVEIVQVISLWKELFLHFIL